MKRRTFLKLVSLGSLGGLALTGACSTTLTDAHGDLTPRLYAPARPLAPRGLALVLGSGGPRGFAHIGALRALAELNVAPDLIVGSSVGAVIGALLAGRVAIDDIDVLARNISAWDLLDVGLHSLSGNFFTGSSVARLVKQRLASERVEQLAVPFALAATRVADKKPALFNHGSLSLALQASVAIVDVAPPVEIAGALYCDGDLACPLPARAARSLGAKKVIAIDVSAYDEDTPTWVREQKSAWLEQARVRNAITAEERPAVDVYLHLRSPYYAGFSREYRAQLIRLGYEQTMARAAEIKQLAQ